MKKTLGMFTLATMLLSALSVMAHNKVVVVPLGGKKCTSPVENSITNSIDMTLNLIPAGTFTMGSPPSEPGRVPSGETQHEVTLTKPFYMQTTEVTNAQWNAFVAALNAINPASAINPSTSNIADHYPVENVNWFEATLFADWLSLAEGLTICYDGQGTCNSLTATVGVDFTCTSVTIIPDCTGYRLPTEAQWEYAARAGTTVAYANPVLYFDDTETGFGFNTNLHAMGWYYYNRAMENSLTEPAYAIGTKPVAQKQANLWDLYDMHGNVYEWCQDWYDGSDYAPGPVTDPQGSLNGSNRAARSGGWKSAAGDTRSAYRVNYLPGDRSDTLGFRLVLPQIQ